MSGYRINCNQKVTLIVIFMPNLHKMAQKIVSRFWTCLITIYLSILQIFIECPLCGGCWLWATNANGTRWTQHLTSKGSNTGTQKSEIPRAGREARSRWAVRVVCAKVWRKQGSMRKGQEGPWSRSRLIKGARASRDLGRRVVGPTHLCWLNQAWGSPCGTSGMWGKQSGPMWDL